MTHSRVSDNDPFIHYEYLYSSHSRLQLFRSAPDHDKAEKDSIKMSMEEGWKWTLGNKCQARGHLVLWPLMGHLAINRSSWLFIELPLTVGLLAISSSFTVVNQLMFWFSTNLFVVGMLIENRKSSFRFQNPNPVFDFENRFSNLFFKIIFPIENCIMLKRNFSKR